jgi:hypothetical protein
VTEWGYLDIPGEFEMNILQIPPKAGRRLTRGGDGGHSETESKA